MENNKNVYIRGAIDNNFENEKVVEIAKYLAKKYSYNDLMSFLKDLEKNGHGFFEDTYQNIKFKAEEDLFWHVASIFDEKTIEILLKDRDYLPLDIGIKLDLIESLVALKWRLARG